jgi:hypothetical protein
MNIKNEKAHLLSMIWYANTRDVLEKALKDVDTLIKAVGLLKKWSS